MTAGFHSEERHDQAGDDPMHRALSERYHQTCRTFESRDADFNARLEARRKSAEEIRQRRLTQLGVVENEYNAARVQGGQRLERAKVQLEAAHRAAGEHCSEIGMPYVPGQTSAADVLRVPLLGEAEAARLLDLPFGTGLSDTSVKILKPALSLLCCVMSGLSLGLGFHLLTAKHLLDNPAMLFLSLIMGGVVAIGFLVSLTGMWKPIGVQMGIGRPKREAAALFIPVTLITTLLFFGAACLDAKALVLLNAAYAALNPAYAIPMGTALLCGIAISGLYVLGLAVTAFADGYSTAAKTNIRDYIKTDENDKREKAKRDVPAREALEALSGVKVAEEVFQRADDDLKRIDQDFKREVAAVYESLPEPPVNLEPDELQTLTDLRAKVSSAKTHYDAYVMSLGGVHASNGIASNVNGN